MIDSLKNYGVFIKGKDYKNGRKEGNTHNEINKSSLTSVSKGSNQALVFALTITNRISSFGDHVRVGGEI